MAQVAVKKGNKVLHVDDTRLESLLEQGFDQIDKDGKVIRKATGGRVVTLKEFNALQDEKEKLNEKIAELKAENKKLKAEAKKQGE
ncbi:hypothetical protein [Niallia sp. RD1]|uniref:hypothetical protein n=1 Tax=Niallia sp. RD1 TaxID=2962858 RepID=UPI0020C1A8D5|nr:hypothetical protein [Niallia sp. RD1]UTI41117.1 hypothetical protein NKG37_19985 [Niallia sp. RD1]